MTKQLMIYGKVAPVNKKKHANLSVKTGVSYSFASDVNSVPLMAVEFPNAASEYPIVFAGKDDNIMPVAILGIQEQQNLYLAENGAMDAKYIPAFLRRYPFIFSSADDGGNFVLCIDESFEGCNEKGIGENLFDAQGEQTQYLKSMLNFLKEFQVHFKRTQIFCKKLKELDLLESVGAQFKPLSGERKTLTGFMAINRAKLQSLSGEQYQQLAKTGELELAYVHLQSLHNFSSLLDRVGVDKSPETTVKAAEEKPAAKSKSKTDDRLKVKDKEKSTEVN